MKKIIISIAILATSLQMFAQTKVKQPNVTIDNEGNFSEIPKNSTADNATLTDKKYTDSKGQINNVYITSKGKYFIMKVSKKTNKEYRKYLITN